MRSPSLMNGGTVIVTPFSSVAGLFTLETVALFSVGSVCVTIKFHRRWQVDTDRRAFVKLRLELQSRRQPLGRVAQIVFTQGGLFVVLGVHEMVMRAVGIEILHFVLLE